MIKQNIFFCFTILTLLPFTEAGSSLSRESPAVPEILSSSMSGDCGYITFRLNVGEGYKMVSSIDQCSKKSSGGIFTFPIYFSDKEPINHEFRLYDDRKNTLIGEIGIMSTSSEFYYNIYHSYMPNYVVYTRSTLPFYHPGQNSRRLLKKPCYSPEIKDFVKKELIKFNPGSIKILSAPNNYNSVIKKATLLMQYFWSLNPPIRAENNPPQNLKEKIERLKAGSCGVLCAGMRDFLFEISIASDSNLKVRTVGAFRFYYPLHPNIVVNSHALLEFLLNGKWWLFDIMHKVYFVWPNGSPMGAEDIAALKKAGRLDRVIPVHIPTAAPPSQHFNPERNPFDPYNNNYFCHFNYFEFIEYND